MIIRNANISCRRQNTLASYRNVSRYVRVLKRVTLCASTETCHVVCDSVGY